MFSEKENGKKWSTSPPPFHVPKYIYFTALVSHALNESVSKNVVFFTASGKQNLDSLY